MHTFKNDGEILQFTNYFDSPEAAMGEFFITTNAGCLRLLVPDNQRALVKEMKCQKAYVSFLKNPDRIEIMFDDQSDNPFRIAVAIEQCDGMIKSGLYSLSVYVRLGEKYLFPCEVKNIHRNVGNKNAQKRERTYDAEMKLRFYKEDKKSFKLKAKAAGFSSVNDWVLSVLRSS